MMISRSRCEVLGIWNVLEKLRHGNSLRPDFRIFGLDWARTRPNVNPTPQIVPRVLLRRIHCEAGPTFVCYTAQVKRPYCNTTNTAGSKSRISWSMYMTCRTQCTT